MSRQITKNWIKMKINHVSNKILLKELLKMLVHQLNQYPQIRHYH